MVAAILDDDTQIQQTRLYFNLIRDLEIILRNLFLFIISILSIKLIWKMDRMEK